MLPALHNLHARLQRGDIQSGGTLADTAAVHLHNDSAGDASRRQPAVGRVRAVPQGAVIGKLLAGLQNGAVHPGKGQGHVAVAVGGVGGHGGVAGKQGEMLLQIGLGHLGFRLQEGRLNVPSVLLGEELPHALQGFGQVHLAAGLFLGKGEGAVLPSAGNGGVLALDHAGLGGVHQLLLSRFGKVCHVVQGIFLRLVFLQIFGQGQLQHVLGDQVVPGKDYGIVPEFHGDLHGVHRFLNGAPSDFQRLVHGFSRDILPPNGGPFREHRQVHLLGGERGGIFLLGAGAQPAQQQQRDRSYGKFLQKNIPAHRAHPFFLISCILTGWEVLPFLAHHLTNLCSLYLPPAKK